MNSFYKAVEKVLQVEKGYVNDPDDLGGETNWGITKKTARLAGYFGPMKSMTKKQAKDIYKNRFWDKLGLDEIADDSEKLAYEMFELGVHSGPEVPGKFFQRILNVMNNREQYYKDIIVDGAVGPQTISAYNKYKTKRGSEGIKVLEVLMNCMQGNRYVELCEARELNEKYMYGWAKNRL